MGVVVQGDPDVPQGFDEPRHLTPVPPLRLHQGGQPGERCALLARSAEIQGWLACGSVFLCLLVFLRVSVTSCVVECAFACAHVCVFECVRAYVCVCVSEHFSD